MEGPWENENLEVPKAHGNHRGHMSSSRQDRWYPCREGHVALFDTSAIISESRITELVNDNIILISSQQVISKKVTL
jgi:hypothetical protein